MANWYARRRDGRSREDDSFGGNVQVFHNVYEHLPLYYYSVLVEIVENSVAFACVAIAIC